MVAQHRASIRSSERLESDRRDACGTSGCAAQEARTTVFNLVILVGTLRASLEDPLTWILIAIVAAIAIYRRPFWMALLVAAGSAVIHLALILPSVKSAGLV